MRARYFSSKSGWLCGFAWLCWLGLAGCEKSAERSSNGGGGAAGSAPVSSTKSVAAPAPPAVPAATRSCAECEAGACEELARGCGVFEGERAAKCTAVRECVRRSGCGRGAESLTACYCGKLSTEKCLNAPATGAEAPDGACKDVIEAGIDDATRLKVLTGFVKTQNPSGAAMAELSCQKANCRAECGLGPPSK